MLNDLRPLLLLVALASGLALAPAPVRAQQDPTQEPPRSQRERAEDQVREVERDGGRVLQAEPMQRGGREVYRLKVLTPEGRVRVLHDSRGRDPRMVRPTATERPPPIPRERPQARPVPESVPEPRRIPRQDDGSLRGRRD